MIENWTYHDKAYDGSSKNIPCTVDSIAQGKSYCSQQFFLSLMIINQVISDRNYLGDFTDAIDRFSKVSSQWTDEQKFKKATELIIHSLTHSISFSNERKKQVRDS